jgi:hypothetical protein
VRRAAGSVRRAPSAGALGLPCAARGGRRRERAPAPRRPSPPRGRPARAATSRVPAPRPRRGARSRPERPWRAPLPARRAPPPCGGRLRRGRRPRAVVDLDVEGFHPDLRQPEALLLDKVEAQDVAPGRPRRHERDVERDRLAGGDRVREGRARAVPDDRVQVPVEPVVGELQAVGAARAPRRGAAVLEHDAGDRRPARALRRQRPLPEARGERLHGGRV